MDTFLSDCNLLLYHFDVRRMQQNVGLEYLQYLLPWRPPRKIYSNIFNMAPRRIMWCARARLDNDNIKNKIKHRQANGDFTAPLAFIVCVTIHRLHYVFFDRMVPLAIYVWFKRWRFWRLDSKMERPVRRDSRRVTHHNEEMKGQRAAYVERLDGVTWLMTRAILHSANM